MIDSIRKARKQFDSLGFKEICVTAYPENKNEAQQL